MVWPWSCSVCALMILAHFTIAFAADDQSLKQPRTAVSRVLCLCLMSLWSRTRKQRWRNRAIRQLHTWETTRLSVCA
ncbi:hypothetical protein V1507DRAFT_466261 [Lipomyces tetrasporus]